MRWISSAAVLLAAGALSACGSGGGSDGSVAPGSPAAPKAVFANPIVDGADVGWESNAEGDVTGYEVTLSAPGQPVLSQNVTATAAQFTGLVAGVAYAVTVVAKDAEGLRSAASSAATVHIPRDNTPDENFDYTNAATYSRRINGDAVMVLRDGQVVFERYEGDFGPLQAHALASGTKSFSCALMLAAQEDGFLTESTKVSDVLTEWKTDANKSRMDVLQLLSLQGGLSTNPAYNPADVSTADTYQLALDDPAAYAPGEAFIYDPLAFQAFALMFKRASGGLEPLEYLKTKVFEPIGLVYAPWQVDRLGNPQMAGGASMTALAWARYGQLMLQNGSWQSQRVLPAEGVQRCLTYRNEAYLGYGITWWVNRPIEGSYDEDIDQIPEDGIASPLGQIAPGLSQNIVMAAGAGGQRLYIIPDQRLVVVRFGRGNTVARNYSDEGFLRRLLGLSVVE